MASSSKSRHQRRVETFLVAAGHTIPSRPTIPKESLRVLQARLLLEETMEAIEAMGVKILSPNKGKVVYQDLSLEPDPSFPMDLPHIAKELADVRVVATGTMSLHGMMDRPIQEEVDENNIAKYGSGIRFRADGKVEKPPNHPKPNLAAVLVAQEYEQNEQETPGMIGASALKPTTAIFMPQQVQIPFEDQPPEDPLMALLKQGCMVVYPTGGYLKVEGEKVTYGVMTSFQVEPADEGAVVFTVEGVFEAMNQIGEVK